VVSCRLNKKLVCCARPAHLLPPFPLLIKQHQGTTPLLLSPPWARPRRQTSQSHFSRAALRRATTAAAGGTPSRLTTYVGTRHLPLSVPLPHHGVVEATDARRSTLLTVPPSQSYSYSNSNEWEREPDSYDHKHNGDKHHHHGDKPTPRRKFSSSKPTSPTANVYTHCGRHSDQWLLGGRSMSDIFKRSPWKKDEPHQSS
jgi:hypothetical protein